MFNLPLGEHRLILQNGSNVIVSWNVGRGQDADHTGMFFCGTRFNGQKLPMGDWRQHRRDMQSTGQIWHIVNIDSLSGCMTNS